MSEKGIICGWLTDSKLLFLAVQVKVTKKKDTRRLVGIFNSNFLRFKSKTGTRRLARCSALNRAQTNARFDPISLSMLVCV